MKNALKNRILWYDGTSEVESSKIAELLISGIPIEQISVLHINEDVKIYNKYAQSKLKIKTSNNNLDYSWNILEKYKYLDTEMYLKNLFSTIEKDSLYRKRIQRFEYEYELFKKHNLFNILNVIVYITDKFKEEKVIWGVGRGSSCSSYILYLIGIHSVDCVLYDIDITDFIGD